MSYIEGSLIKDEKVLHLGRISWWSLTPWILGGLLLLPLFGAGLLVWLVGYVRYKTTELAITNKRVIVKLGFIRRQTVEISISKVESIQVDQSLWGRVFNFGSLVITGSGSSQAPIHAISDPLGFRRAFVEAQEVA
ncbi:PH domain-containing protein [Uliginosibacterium sp. H3]|uniref:PH domain-containing protein n=1 Tax=Uliginosibacterium silvisoli TaxID=3114758 RepID=A0ABU6K0M4_9RHOO|nr:PH domain-containing protein [Uliginosibacterium sp. H3]